MYKIYTRRRSEKRAKSCGILTDNFEEAKTIANNVRNSWWGQNGIYIWIKVKDLSTNKYVYAI